MTGQRVHIVGAGIVGLATAAALVQRGCSVTIFDREGVAAGASRGNAAAIAWTDVAPLASPGIWKEAIGWLADPLGPLSVRPAYSLKILPWMLRFLAASSKSRVEASTQALAALNGEAYPAWDRLWKASGTHNQVRHEGCLEVFDNEAKLQRARPSWAEQRRYGIDVTELSGDDLRAQEPELSDHVVGGALLPGWTQVDDPLHLCQSLASWLKEQGVLFELADVSAIVPTEHGADVRLVSGETHPADHVVVACGPWSRMLASQLGDAVPLDTERGYNITVPSPGLKLRRFVMLPGHGFVLSPLSTGLRIGGAVEFGGLELAPNWKRVDAMITKAKSLFPNLDASKGERWMGFRPSLPDSLPVIGPASASNRVTYAFGHAHHGLTQAATTGELITALVIGEKPAVDLLPFSAQRF
ncbi:D-amino-acid dehydrogenase [Roseibium sp. TrichSKD4]|uniref:NAD(P)/FAD-dependent oxidoreductase n=1 Tax=Roseibium sp. TrichSKD4 TaxID=744980 RepID=UPI0001E56EA5|nr:FAD-dependent oxidoreductase [Roseibium sp. TrichSKD4]EFO31598.1 D-amino-acid dehydrogenase [Roseibium sp. TrichSKD4]